MKKIGLLILALVLALGALGVGYAAWTDTITINGSVSTGEVCLSIERGTYGEVNTCPPSQFATLPDQNWSGWLLAPGSESCPSGYEFGDIFCTDKDVADMEFVPVLDADGNIVELEVTIHNAYPHYLGHLTFEVCNCGNIPVKLEAPVFNQSPFLLIEYRNGTGTQIEPGRCHEVSLFVGVVQHEGYYNTDGVWIVDDPSMPLLPQDDDLTFTIDVTAIQWDQFPP